jgi:predicted ABC-type ATPase
MTHPRWLWIVAGSNGAGKSSYAKSILSVPIVDPDNPVPGARLGAFAAGRRTLEWIDAQIDAQRSFGIETTLAGLG